MNDLQTPRPEPDMPFPCDVTRTLRNAARRVAAIKCANARNRRGWHGHPAVRQFIVECYGRLSIDEASREAQKRFGALAPSQSAIGRFYKAVSDHLRTGGAS